MVLDVLGALAPPVGVGLLFFLIVRAMVHADRRERAALARQTEVERATWRPDDEDRAP